MHLTYWIVSSLRAGITLVWDAISKACSSHADKVKRWKLEECEYINIHDLSDVDQSGQLLLLAPANCY